MTKKQILLMFFQSTLNVPYKWGGDDPMEGFDCSGYVQEALSTIGLDPIKDQTAHALYLHFKNPIYARQSVLQFGSILFFGTGEKIKHVAIALNEKSMIEAGGGSSKTINTKKAIQQNAYVKIRPITRRNDLHHFVLPTGL